MRKQSFAEKIKGLVGFGEGEGNVTKPHRKAGRTHFTESDLSILCKTYIFVTYTLKVFIRTT